MKDLGVSPRRFGKFKKVVLEDAKKLAVAFEKDETFFTEYFSVKTENIENSTIPIHQETVNKNHFINTENFNVNSEKKPSSQFDGFQNNLLQQIEELKSEKQEIKEEYNQRENDLKVELQNVRQELGETNVEFRKMAEKATDYQEKYYEARRLLQSPQNTDSSETPNNQKWWRLKVPSWVQWGSWIVLIAVSFILLFSNQILSFFTSIH